MKNSSYDSVRQKQTYYELEEQIKHNVLYESHCFNDNILGKFLEKIWKIEKFFVYLHRILYKLFLTTR